MSPQQLANKLSTMYHTAIKGEMATMVHLFGIRYSSQIKSSTASPREIAELAGISPKYGTEINKGIKIAKYASEQ